MARAQHHEQAMTHGLRKKLHNLQTDFAALSKQVENMSGDAGDKAIAEMKAGLERVSESFDAIVDGASAAGHDAMDAVKEMSNSVFDNVETTAREHPLTTLAVAAGVGFILGATMRR